MTRLLFATLAVLGTIAICRAQEAIPVSHSHSPVAIPFVEGPACATGHCSTCQDCLRVPDIKKTQVPVYSCKEKEICIPNCGLFGLFGCKSDCKKIVIRQLVKKYRTDEECVMKCMTPEEAVKKYEADAKKARESAPPPPAATPAPAKLPTTMSAAPVSTPTFIAFTRPD